MAHGESCRCDPGRLEWLVVDGGLPEVSFHVDKTQRGGRTRARSDAHECELHTVRGVGAELVHAARRRTGITLLAASTVTVANRNAE